MLRPCGFSAIARSVMISAADYPERTETKECFSAIARSVMISAIKSVMLSIAITRFSAIARSVMISASLRFLRLRFLDVSVL